MGNTANIEASDLQRFARLAAPLLQGTAARGLGPRAARNRPGPGLEFLDMRYYQPGDDIRHIDWRQSARRQRTVVRRFRDEAAADWFICADCSASVRLGEGKWPLTVQLTSALAYALLFAGHRVALLIFSDRIQGIRHLGRGAHQFSALLDLLLQQDAASSGPATGARALLPSRLRWRQKPAPAAPESTSKSNLGLCRDFLTPNGNVFVISDFLEPDGMRSDLRSIRSAVSSANALQVLAKDEVHVPTTGITRLQDVESGRRKQLLISDQALKRARQALESHRNTLHRDCAALGIRFASCDTGERWERVLLAHLNARSQACPVF